MLFRSLVLEIEPVVGNEVAGPVHESTLRPDDPSDPIEPGDPGHSFLVQVLAVDRHAGGGRVPGDADQAGPREPARDDRQIRPVLQMLAHDAFGVAGESADPLQRVEAGALDHVRRVALEEVSVRIERDLVREGEDQAVIDWVEAAMAGYEVRRS